MRPTYQDAVIGLNIKIAQTVHKGLKNHNYWRNQYLVSLFLHEIYHCLIFKDFVSNQINLHVRGDHNDTIYSYALRRKPNLKKARAQHEPSCVICLKYTQNITQRSTDDKGNPGARDTIRKCAGRRKIMFVDRTKKRRGSHCEFF